MSLIDTLKALAITVRNEKKKEANSAVRIGDLFIAIIDFIKSVQSGEIRQDGVDSYNDTSDGKTSLLNKYPNPELNWTVLVRNDEKNVGKASLYKWNGSKWINLETVIYNDDVASLSDLPYLRGSVTGNQDVSTKRTDEGLILTIPIGMDIYGSDGKHVKRFTEEKTCKLHDGTGRIQYNAKTDKLTSSGFDGLDKDAYIIGLYAGENIQLDLSSGKVKQIDMSGKVENILYRGIYDKDLLRNTVVKVASRSPISINRTDRSFILGVGEIYFRMGDGSNRTLRITEAINHQFPENKSSEYAYNLDIDGCIERDTSSNPENTNRPVYRDIPLFVYDANKGFCGGVLYDYYIKNYSEKIISENVTRDFMINTGMSSVAFISSVPVFNIDLTTRQITLASGAVDLYFGKSGFDRISIADFYAKIAATGTSRLWYNSKHREESKDDPDRKGAFVSGAYAEGYYLLGHVLGGKIFPNAANYRIEYSDGSVQNGVATSDFVKEISAEKIPSFVVEEALKTWKRVNDFIGSRKNATVFLYFTDLHSGGRDTYKHIGYIAEIEKLFGFSCVANLGDIGLNVAATNVTTDAADELLNKIAIEHGKFKCPVLSTNGNHDYDGGAGTIIPPYRFSNYLQQPSKRKTGSNYQIKEGTAYGYLDIEENKVRFIFTDSSQPIPYGYDKEQLKYITEVLTNTPNNYTVVVLSHRFPDQKGDWLNNGQVVEHDGRVVNEKTFREIFRTFVAKSAGSDLDNLGLSWDFTNTSGKLAGIFCGDSHFDVDVKVDGVGIYCSQGYGGINTATSLPPHGVVTPFDPKTQMLAEVVVILDGEVGMFRMGAGGESRDRQFNFLN